MRRGVILAGLPGLWGNDPGVPSCPSALSTQILEECELVLTRQVSTKETILCTTFLETILWTSHFGNGGVGGCLLPEEAGDFSISPQQVPKPRRPLAHQSSAEETQKFHNTAMSPPKPADALTTHAHTRCTWATARCGFGCQVSWGTTVRLPIDYVPMGAYSRSQEHRLRYFLEPQADDSHEGFLSTSPCLL